MDYARFQIQSAIKDSLIQDLDKTEEFNPFSEKSKELITSTEESFKLCETSSEVQCPVPCDSSLPSGRLSEVYLEFCDQRYRDKFPCTYLADFLRDACDVCPREVSDIFPFTARFVRFDGRRIFALRDWKDPDVHDANSA